ncbi:unnamed protein product [Cunninghamella blakesleeana]
MANNDIDTTSFSQQLDSLKQLRESTQQLIHCKASIFKNTDLLESKTNLLEELRAERLQRVKEKRLLLDMIQSVQRDIDTLTDMENTLGRECDDLQNNMLDLKNEEYERLHENVNIIRVKKGLSKIPHVQQDREAEMAKRLQERRENWQQGSISADTSYASQNRTTPSINQSSRNQRGRAKKRRQ